MYEEMKKNEHYLSIDCIWRFVIGSMEGVMALDRRQTSIASPLGAEIDLT